MEKQETESLRTSLKGFFGLVLVLALAIFMFWVVLFAFLPPDSDAISVEQLATEPAKYQHVGMNLKVRGYCNIQFEGDHGLYSRDFRIKENSEKPLYALRIELPNVVNPFTLDGCVDGQGKWMVAEGRLELVDIEREDGHKKSTPTLIVNTIKVAEEQR